MGDLSDDSVPAVVWFYSPDDDKSLRAVDGNIFQNERVGLALKKFRCFRVNVLEIPSAELREKYEKAAPSFMFFDPNGDQVAEVSGKRAESLSGFSGVMERTWDSCFSVSLKQYTKGMTKILDRLDRLDSQRQALERDRARLEERPNPAKQRKLAGEEEELKAELAQLAEDEKALLTDIELRPEYRPTEEASLRR